MFWQSIITILLSSVFIGTLLYYQKNSPVFMKKSRKIGGRLRRILSLFFIVAISIMSGFVIVTSITRMTYYKNINGYAEWKDSKGQDYLYIYAEDYYSLGYLEGKNLYKQIQNMELLLQDFMGFLPADYRKYVKYYDSYIPEKYKEELMGIADGASAGAGLVFTYEDILLQNVFVDIIYGLYFGSGSADSDGNQGPIGCSVISVKNNIPSSRTNNTPDPIIQGQNFDFPGLIGTDGLFNTLAWVLTELKNENRGNVKIFGLRLGAAISSSIARSSSNLTIMSTILNTKIKAGIGTPLVVKLKEILESCSTPSEALSLLIQDNATLSINLIFSNRTSHLAVQYTPNFIKTDNEDILLFTNRFNEQQLNEKYLNQPDYSLERNEKLREMVNESLMDGKFTENDLVNTLSTKIDGENSSYSIIQYEGPIKTLAFFTNTYFGMGTLADSPKGLIPI